MSKLFTIELLPNSNKLRELIKNHGNLWQTDSDPSLMPCFNGQLGIRVKSHIDQHVRNIRIEDTSWGSRTNIESFVR